MEITKQSVRQISDEALAALQAVAAEHGLSVEAKGGTFGGGEFVAKFSFKTGSADADAFALHAPSLGLLPEHFEAIFENNGTRYKIVGIAPANWKRPIIAEKLNGADGLPTGQRYKFTADSVRAALTAAGLLQALFPDGEETA